MDLSLVDLSPVPEGGTAVEAFENTVQAAKQAEALGYTRFWAAEHHGMADRLAGTTPEVLLGALSAETDTIRLGSGAVLLNHYSPFKVAEVFGTLDGLAPGRIDAGLGRANGSPATDHALGTERHVENPDENHAEKIEAVCAHLAGDFPSNHPYSDLSVPRSGGAPPAPWVLARVPRVRNSPPRSGCDTVLRRSSGRSSPSMRSKPITTIFNRRHSPVAWTNHRGWWP